VRFAGAARRGGAGWLTHRVALRRTFRFLVCSRAQLISPFTVYFNTHLIFRELQLWRLVSNFFFFGSLGAPRRNRPGTP
jgi:hypothetical protein